MSASELIQTIPQGARIRSGRLASMGISDYYRGQEPGKPILLSIGFFGSSGCKTMLKESFFKESTAEVINSSFFPIKVDNRVTARDMKAYQIAFNFDKKPTGWPLTVF